MDSRTRMNARDLGHYLGGFFQDVPIPDLELKLSLPNVDMALIESPPLQPTGAVDVEVLDDEVSIISSRIFLEGRQSLRSNQSQEIHGSVRIIHENVAAHNVVSEVTTSRETKRRRTSANGPLEPSMDNKKKASDASMLLKLAEQPTLTCPICMEHLKEETTTKCGHIFCMKCIKTALATQSKCPTCRQKVAKRGGIFRIYLNLPSSTD